MANRRRLCVLAPVLLMALAGCVSVRNDTGLNPPIALCSHVRATVGLPYGPVACGSAVRKVGRADGSIMVKDWIFSGVSANVVNMALQAAITKGDIARLYYADYEQTSYLGLVTVFNVVAYGE